MDQVAQLDRIKVQLTRAEERVKLLTGQTDGLRDRADKAEKELAEKTSELDKLVAQHDSLRSLVAVRAERIRELEQSLGERERLVEDLKEELEQREKDHAAEIDAIKQEHVFAIEQTKLESIPPPAPERPDDLRKIKGIGPKYEKALIAHGINRYEQIAGWSDEDIERIADELNINKKRIENAGWVESAKALRGGKKGDLNW